MTMIDFVDVTVIGGPRDGLVISIADPAARLGVVFPAYANEPGSYSYDLHSVQGKWYAIPPNWDVKRVSLSSNFTEAFRRAGGVPSLQNRMAKHIAARVQQDGRRLLGNLVDQQADEAAETKRMTLSGFTVGLAP